MQFDNTAHAIIDNSFQRLTLYGKGLNRWSVNSCAREKVFTCLTHDRQNTHRGSCNTVTTPRVIACIDKMFSIAYHMQGGTRWYGLNLHYMQGRRSTSFMITDERKRNKKKKTIENCNDLINIYQLDLHMIFMFCIVCLYIYILCIITTWLCLIIFVNWFWFWNCKFFFVSLKENIINIVAYIYITKNIWILNVEFAQKINIFIELNKYRNYNNTLKYIFMLIVSKEII